ncbi:MAG: 3-dehydro-L-gulonate 2-dehydrogenase, partial [Melioribacteraceae bacterium]|nr:3-dehydro-L-gulonate 2-dehydrogenase [Melioribacteraceae bacterium]
MNKICKLLIESGLDLEKANKVAEVLSNSTLDGINSHGINRVPLLLEYIRKGYVSVNAEPEIVSASNSFCQVDGKFGLGILNAQYCTNKAMEIAAENGVGLVSIKNTNHWHRAGSYGWEAADKGFILIAWTNTIPIVPPYGSNENLIGNNPLVIAIPRSNNEHIVLDMSTSQYSYGAIANHARQKKELSEYGGYDASGNLTKDASEIKSGGRHMPIGFWKGSALTIVLDFVAAILSGGKTTNDLGKNADVDTGMSQVFIAIDPKQFGDENFQQNLINETLNNFKEISRQGSNSIRYPGQGVLERRKNNLRDGIPIEKEIWEMI